ncbi:MAG: hypothetical protein DRP85_06425 [Candidatus Makaraimicrobium thalassicum]|nr:MAG: hypothetical protein DRP85_06425 [Candidatus Omnitrophota bacterium]
MRSEMTGQLTEASVTADLAVRMVVFLMGRTVPADVREDFFDGCYQLFYATRPEEGAVLDKVFAQIEKAVNLIDEGPSDR